MITRLEVDGFKSLRQLAVDFEPFTVLVGPNSAGKSNILDALALLSRLASMPITEAFKRGRGRMSDQFTRHGGEAGKSMRFAVETLERAEYPEPSSEEEWKTSQTRFRYELSIERRELKSGVERLVVQDEHLRRMRREDDAWIHAHPEFRPFAAYARGGEDSLITVKSERRARQKAVVLIDRPEEVTVATDRIALTSTSYMEPSSVRMDLEGCQWLRLDSGHLGNPSERADAGPLSPDASNLPTVLAGLPPAILGAIQADLIALVPGVTSFEIVPEGDALRIDFGLSGGERLPARLVSDGTLRILALLTALRMEPRPHLIGIEEAENGVYPGHLRALVGLLRDSAARYPDPPALPEEVKASGSSAAIFFTNLLPTQVVMTTHSPVVLAALRSSPQHLRFVDTVRRNGERVTRVRPVGKATGPAAGRSVVSPREIDMLLHSVRAEDAE